MDEKEVVRIINEKYGLYYTALKANKAPDYGSDYYSVLIRRDGREDNQVYLVTSDCVVPIPG